MWAVRGVFSLLIAFIVGVQLLFQVPAEISLQRSGVRSDVRVVKVENSGGHVGRILVEIEGEIRNIEWSNPGEVKVGDKVAVIYYRNRPGDARASGTWVWKLVVFPALLILVLLVQPRVSP